jgi:hypothetical protein
MKTPKTWQLLAGSAVLVLAASVALCVLSADDPRPVEGYGPREFAVPDYNVTYEVEPGGGFLVTEEFTFDFGEGFWHGPQRDVTLEYAYDETYKRVIRLSELRAYDGNGAPLPVHQVRDREIVYLRVGREDALVTGVQQYRLQYRVTGGLNAVDGRTEFYWNAAYHAREFPIQRATATVVGPRGALVDATCYGGLLGEQAECVSSHDGSSASFDSRDSLVLGSFLTVVAAFDPDAVSADGPMLVRYHRTTAQKVRDFLGLNPPVIASTVAISLGLAVLLGRSWWRGGRDRWYGDNYYLTQEAVPEKTRPLFARETIVPEYEPPRPAARESPLRPAETGMLIDEQVDGLHISATVVDLAVRGYLRIQALPDSDEDYLLVRKRAADDGLLAYEAELLRWIFKDATSFDPDGDGPGEASRAVRLSLLRESVGPGAELVKRALSRQVVRTNAFFVRDPDATRLTPVSIGFLGLVIVPLVAAFAGLWLGVALLGAPFLLASVAMVAGSRLMPQRTGVGREMYRRSLGFRQFLLGALQERMRFAEDAGIFERYLPYALVFRCARKWSERFAGIDRYETSDGWFAGAGITDALDAATATHLLCNEMYRVFDSPVWHAGRYQSFPGGGATHTGGLGQPGVGGAGTGWSVGGSGLSGFSGGGGGFAGGGGGGGGGGAW